MICRYNDMSDSICLHQFGQKTLVFRSSISNQNIEDTMAAKYFFIQEFGDLGRCASTESMSFGVSSGVVSYDN